jgi:hypothetical protein
MSNLFYLPVGKFIAVRQNINSKSQLKWFGGVMWGKGVMVLLYLFLILLASPKLVLAEIALPPDQACKALRSLDLKTGPYELQGASYVCAATKKMEAGKLPNVLEYQVVGDRHKVEELRLELSVDAPRKQGAAKSLLIESALLIARKVGWNEDPDGLEEAVRRRSEGSWKKGDVILRLVKYPVPDPPGCYKLILTAR